jgi:hypothetical protein
MFKLKCSNRDCYLMTTTNNDGAIELILTDATNAWKGRGKKSCNVLIKKISYPK